MGIQFQYHNLPTPFKYVVETIGFECAFLDYNRDDYLDIFRVIGGRLPAGEKGAPLDHALYETEETGLL